MAKQAALLQSFNAGEWSPLMTGRVDLDKYRASCTRMRNFMPTPQGAAVARNGTAFVVPAVANSTTSALLPFQFSTIQSCVLEFGVGVLRFITEDGLTTTVNNRVVFVTHNGTQVQVTVNSTSGYSVGQTVTITGTPEAYGLNNTPSTIQSINGNNITLNMVWPSTAQATNVSGTLGALYTIPTPYTDATKLNSIRYAQKNDVLYLFCDGYQVYKLSRLAATDWTLAPVTFIDGPYLDVNYENNRAVPVSTGGAPPANFVWTAGSSDNQSGTATWSYSSSIALTGYQIVIPNDDDVTVSSTIYSAKDRAPSTWTLEGSNDNSSWTAIDTQTVFVDYENNCTDWIPLYGNQAYQYYRILVTQTYIQQSVTPTMQTVLCTSKTDAPFVVNFDNTTNINFGAGFTASDVGRLLRLQRSDGTWIAATITQVNSATQIACSCTTAPLLDTTATTWWRLGLFCSTNGFPTCGVFYSERLWMAGCENYPDTVVGSEVGNYETFQPNDPRTGNVTDSDAINITLESRSQVLWMNADDRGLVMGTAAGEWTIQSGGYTNYTTASVITPTSVRARSPTQRGSANVDAVRIDHQTLHVQRSGRQARAMAYSFEIDGYSSTSLSTQASHLGQPSIVRMAYQAEPYSTVWFVRSDGILLALTYMVDEQVTGWSYHDIGGVVESCATIPSPDSQQDTLWLVVKRTINGQTVRYIERMLRLWDFDMDQYDAAFVDCCTVSTSLTQNVGGLYHLAGQQVYALIDGTTPAGPITVGQDGTMTLPSKPAVQAVIGLGMTASLVTQRIEAGAQNGTAQGKTKRIDQIVANLWASGSGNIGTPATLNNPEDRVTPIQYNAQYGVMDAGPLHSFQYPFVMPAGYDRNGSILVSRNENDLLPLNVVSITAFVDTQDAEG